MRTLIMTTGTTVHEMRLDSEHRPVSPALNGLEKETREELFQLCKECGPFVPHDPNCVMVVLRGATFLLGVWVAQHDNMKCYVFPSPAKNDFRGNFDFMAFIDGFRMAKGTQENPRLFFGPLDAACLSKPIRTAKPRDMILSRIDEESYEDLVALGAAGSRVAVEILSPDRVQLDKLVSDIASSLPAPQWNRDGRDSQAALWAAGEIPEGTANWFISDGEYQAPYQSDWEPPALARAAHGVYLHEEVDQMTEEEDHHLLNQSRYANRSLGLKWPAAPRLFIGVTQSLAARRKVYPFRWDSGVYLYLNKQDDAIEIDTKDTRSRVEALELEYASNVPGRAFMSLKQQEIGIEAGSALAARYMLVLREVFGIDKASSMKRARRILWGLK
jgi:hypothetical protein